MDSISDLAKLCRLCLVNEDVDVPIFGDNGDIQQIFLKISACLPVKVSKEDNLPKSICMSCVRKLDMFYKFWNTSVSSEKQLLKWLEHLPTKSSDDGVLDSIPAETMVLKEEVIELSDNQNTCEDLADMNVPNEDPDYALEHQQLQYQPVEFQFQQDGFESMAAGEDRSVVTDTRLRPRKRRVTAVKTLSNVETEDEDDLDVINTKIAKTEEESDDNAADDPEPSTFAALQSADDEQPGPSGVGKSSSDTPDEVKMESDACENYHLAFNYKKQRQKRMWNCTKCNECFDTSRKLRNHRKIHRKKIDDVQYNYRHDKSRNIFICYTCDLESSSKEEMEKHVLEHEDKHTCKICDKTFVKPYEYCCHVYNHEPSKGFSCPFCKYTTHRRTAIMIHINTFHLRRFIYSCQLCGKGFNDCVLFKEHSNVHEGKRPFRCVVCEKDFVFSSYLTSHQIRYHKVPIDGMLGTNQCFVCSKTFKRTATLEKHLEKHNDDQKKVHEKKHLCDICGKGFAQTEKLRIHYRVHTGIKPYTCSYCAKSFTKRDYLIMHERVHSGEKPYSCEYCGKCFNQGAPLRLHIRSHTGERPYLCHLCNTGYISRSVLNVHLRNCPGSTI